MKHFLGKLCITLRIAWTLIMARTFGKYLHSTYDGRMEYAEYRWRGSVWAFPKSPIED